MQKLFKKRTVLLLFVIIITGFLLLRSIVIRGANGAFCTPDDMLYQTIDSNKATWQEYFFYSPQSAAATHLYFPTDDRPQFTVIKLEPDQFFVVTEYDTPHTYLGAKGYIVSPQGIPTAWSEYKYSLISEGIYCYKK